MFNYSQNIINVITALLVVLLGLFVANISSNSLRRILRNIEINNIFKEELKLSLDGILSNITKYAIYFITAIIALNRIGVSTRTIQMVFLIFLAVAIVFVILAFKDFAPNLVSGFYILRTRKINKGDWILIDGLEGKIMAVNLVETKIETKNKELIFIPNSRIMKYKVIKK